MNFVKLEVPDQCDGFGSRTLFIKSTAITAVATSADLADGVWVYFDGRVLFVSATAEDLLERINAVQV